MEFKAMLMFSVTRMNRSKLHIHKVYMINFCYALRNMRPKRYYFRPMSILHVEDWGMIKYEIGRQRQQQIFKENIEKKLKGSPVSQRLILCEHYPVITIGKSGRKEHLLYSLEWLQSKGVDICETERGGDITFHGPGQLVAYPLLDIDALQMGIKKYIYLLEESIILMLHEWGIQSERYEGYTGVWLDPLTSNARKIAAIGVKCSRGVSMHGMALNIHTDLSYFDAIVPCGISDKKVSSVFLEKKEHYSMALVKKLFVNCFCQVFELTFQQEGI
jgi:lipoyl(octanoyl) transferase